MSTQRQQPPSRGGAGGGEWLAAGIVVVALAAFAGTRVTGDDVLFHLATARVFFEQGHWPVVNTFSWTHPDYPLYQQYPVFHSLLWAAHRAGGWIGIGLLKALGWATAFFLFVRWGSRYRRALCFHLPWMLALWGLQRRLQVRPDLVSALLLGVGLLVVDAHLSGRRKALWLLPVVQLLWVNGHQLFPVFLAMQGALVLHVLAARLWPSRVVALPPGATLATPVLVALLSTATMFLSPLGFEVVNLFSHTAGSLHHHRAHVQEFAYIWNTPLELALLLLTGVPTLVVVLASRRVHLFELGVWSICLLLTLAAMRGIGLFAPVSVAVFVRILERGDWRRPWPTLSPPIARQLRGLAVLATLFIGATVVRYRWVQPAWAIGGTQTGLGRSLGDWPDAAMAFLDRAPPPGRMMNVPWSLAATLWFHPEIPVFVDPRFEAYPRAFLLDAIASMADDAVMDRLLDTHQPGWIFAAHCDADVRARVARLFRQGRFVPVHADASTIILVDRGQDDYLRAHALSALPAAPADLHVEVPAIASAQRRCWQDLRAALTSR